MIIKLYLLCCIIIIMTNQLPVDKNEDAPMLSLNDMNTNFLVVSSMNQGDKLVIKGKYLEIDKSYFRYTDGTTRSRLVSFLSHMHNECNRIIDDIMDDIKGGSDLDDNVYNLRLYIYNLINFIEKLKIIEDTYMDDSLIVSKMKTLRENFMMHYNGIFDKLCKSKSKEAMYKPNLKLPSQI